ncbi:hypothetical protein DYD21_15935 [Rhodohalobacter sp. SW132]|uniref:metallophosphoesterase n=1 Tax=Rhodohalobacter sp. SW132 TaxID=2293433 RepID=UPI000E2580ED|nr:metallophosphoesterase [Rhodohalobacter sp. SW132]REL25006.1 hypothetical protein DYD21_15935 [Rhodohalobacter sp. SW132]
MPWPLRMTLLISAITVICMFYNALRIHWYTKQTGLYQHHIFWGIFSTVVVVIFAYPLSGWLINESSGGFSREWYPVWMIALFWFGFIFNTVLLSWILAADFINAVLTWVFRIRRPQLQTILGLAVLAVSFIVFFYTASKTIYDTNRVKIETIMFEHPSDYFDENRSLRIAHISEIHADRYTSPEKINRYIQRTGEQNPDIVFVTGDLISSGLDYVEIATEALGSINPPLGVHFVMGDHDYWSGQDQIAESLEEQGVNVLRDENQWIDFGDTTIKITGVTEVYSTSIDRSLLRELLSETNGEQLSILFSHQAPDDLITIAQESGTDVLLKGHTHGGQIRIPLFFRKFTAASMETDYVIGHWLLDDMLLNVNSGLGFTLAPLRYNAPAEVSVIEIN